MRDFRKGSHLADVDKRTAGVPTKLLVLLQRRTIPDANIVRLSKLRVADTAELATGRLSQVSSLAWGFRDHSFAGFCRWEIKIALASVLKQSRISPVAFSPVSTGIVANLSPFRSFPSPCAALLVSF